MNAALIAKIFGWVQFLLPAAAAVATTGGPHGTAAWAGFAASLATAVGVHAASSTDGKPQSPK